MLYDCFEKGAEDGSTASFRRLSNFFVCLRKRHICQMGQCHKKLAQCGRLKGSVPRPRLAQVQEAIGGVPAGRYSTVRYELVLPTVLLRRQCNRRQRSINAVVMCSHAIQMHMHQIILIETRQLVWSSSLHVCAVLLHAFKSNGPLFDDRCA